MPRTNSETANRKAKKSFTLPLESVAFLVEKTITDYYSSLTTEDAKEQTCGATLPVVNFQMSLHDKTRTPSG